MGFTIVDTGRWNVAELVRAVPGLVPSSHYQILDAEEQGSRRFVLAALGGYLLDLAKRSHEADSDSSEQDQLRHGLAFVERLASLGDDESENLLITEVFNLWDGPEGRQVVESLGSNSRALWERWMMPA